MINDTSTHRGKAPQTPLRAGNSLDHLTQAAVFGFFLHSPTFYFFVAYSKSKSLNRSTNHMKRRFEANSGVEVDNCAEFKESFTYFFNFLGEVKDAIV